MNEVIKAMKERRSIRRFKPDMPRKEDIELIAEAGLWAPSGRGMQDSKTIIITDPEMRERFAEANCKAAGMPEGTDPFYGGPVVMAVIAAKDRITNICDGSLVIGNMMLAAHSLGLGSIWIHRAKEEFEQPEFVELLKKLGIDGEWVGVGHCVVGYIDGEPPRPAARKEDRVFWIE